MMMKDRRQAEKEPLDARTEDRNIFTSRVDERHHHSKGREEKGS